MGRGKYFFTSESVTEGHPDKVCDQISDAVLDEVLRQDPMGRVACESFVTTGTVLVAGEITTTCYVEVPELVRSVVKDIGYVDARMGYANAMGYIAILLSIAFTVHFFLKLQKSRRELGMGD